MYCDQRTITELYFFHLNVILYKKYNFFISYHYEFCSQKFHINKAKNLKIDCQK